MLVRTAARDRAAWQTRCIRGDVRSGTVMLHRGPRPDPVVQLTTGWRGERIAGRGAIRWHPVGAATGVKPVRPVSL